MEHGHIEEIAAAYLARFPEESVVIAGLRHLIRAGADVTSRRETRGHVTCGGIVVGPDGRVLMVRHRILDRWLFPGGHLEAQDATLRDGALREIEEETGLRRENVTGFRGELDLIPIHIDCHMIPANPAKDEPDHQHFDFRFLFRASSALLRRQDEEVLGCEWMSADHTPIAIRKRLLQFKSG